MTEDTTTREPIKGIDELSRVLDAMEPEVRRSLGQAALGRVSELKRVRKKLTGLGLEPDHVDEELELWQGTKGVKGIFHVLEVSDTATKKEDPAQRDIEDEADYRTWDCGNIGELRELISAEVSDTPAPAAIRALNALEDGENQRDPKPRKSYLDAIRDARRPLIAKVDSIKVVN